MMAVIMLMMTTTTVITMMRVMMIFIIITSPCPWVGLPVGLYCDRERHVSYGASTLFVNILYKYISIRASLTIILSGVVNLYFQPFFHSLFFGVPCSSSLLFVEFVQNLLWSTKVDFSIFWFGLFNFQQIYHNYFWFNGTNPTQIIIGNPYY